jgi:predicted metal-binding membrane protein
MSSIPNSHRPGKQERFAPRGEQSWLFVLLSVAILCLLGWSYLIAMIADMLPAMDMAEAGPGMALFNNFNLFKGLPAETRAALALLCLPVGSTFGMPSLNMDFQDLSKVFLMWSMMAMAMMLPSATPMLRAYHDRFRHEEHSLVRATLPVVMVSIGFLLVWFGYAVLATLAQWVLSKIGALTDMMAPASLAFTISILFAAGLYQFTPAKRACLQRCWYPRWVFGPGAATAGSGLREGLVQGWACLGCCWAVMTVMFAVGLMNIIWIALLGGIMALEKTFPSRILPNLIGIGLISWSAFLAGTLVLNV